MGRKQRKKEEREKEKQTTGVELQHTSCGDRGPYQRVGGLPSLQGDLQVGQGRVHLVHLLLAVVHVVVRRHDGQLVDVVLRERNTSEF